MRTRSKMQALRFQVTATEMRKLCKHERYTAQLLKGILGQGDRRIELFKLCEAQGRKVIAVLAV